MTRLLIVGDPALLLTRVPLPAFVAEAIAHPQIELVGLCDAGREDLASLQSRVRHGLRRTARRLFNRNDNRLGPGLNSWRKVAQDSRLPVLTPNRRDLNSSSFRDELRDRWRPDAILCLGCLQILSPSLLSIFSTAINFHNGLLPDYRGLNATPWSLYNREPRTGYSFHHITAGIDEGPVVVDGSFAIEDGATQQKVDLAKCVAAAGDARRVLDAIVAKAPGTSQNGGNYYSRQDRKRICRIARPKQLSSAEIQHRLDCFGLLEVQICGRWWEITQLSQHGAPSFATADGQLGVGRALFLPPSLYRLYRGIRGGGKALSK